MTTICGSGPSSITFQRITPILFGVDLSAQMRDRCEEVIARANPPPVILEESERARMIREFDEREGSA
jgi:hypothetical protein